MKKKQLKEIFSGEFGDVTFEGKHANIDVWEKLTCQIAEEICSYTSVTGIGLKFGETDPSIEEIQAFHILVARFCKTITSLDLDAYAPWIEGPRDQNHFLMESIIQLRKIENLEFFYSRFLNVNDAVALALVKPSVDFFSVEPEENVTVTAKIIPSLTRCSNLKGLSIKSQSFGKQEVKRLEEVLPNLVNIDVIGYLKGWE